ncbi:MAG: DNA-binding response regulator [Planctomycetota bacterium]|nr:MAG: DNA-binding response regulator [Planctomycetota bacterium]
MTASRRILLVEDDENVAATVAEGLAARGYEVSRADSLSAARSLLRAEDFALLILDLNLPDGTGLELAARIREQHGTLPILILTARTSVADRVSGFRHGADDYLCKPFDFEELAARVEAILRRTRKAAGHVLQYLDLELDLITRTIRRGEIETVLSAREAELLAYFLRHPEQVLPRDRILRDVWREEAEEDSNVLNVYVNYLRNKTEQGMYGRLIHTIRGRGYVLSGEDPEQRGPVDER